MSSSNCRQSRELFGFATSLDTDEVYREAGEPYPDRALAHAVTPLIVRLGKETGAIDNSIEYATDVDGSPSLLLWRGINDMQRVLVPRLKLQTTYESAAAYIRHEKTAHSLALLALRNYEAMENLIRELEDGKGEYHPTKSSPHFELPWHEATPSASRGCPVAIHASPDRMQPLWRNFAVWMGEISLKGIVHHGNDIKPDFLRDP